MSRGRLVLGALASVLWSASCELSSTDLGTVAEIVPPSVVMLPGEATTLQYRAGRWPLDGAWSTLDSGVVAVDGQGRVTALQPGTATVRASRHGAFAIAPVSVVEEASRIGAGPNEPLDYRPITDRSFGIGSGEGWVASGEGELFQAQDATAPISQPGVGQIVFPEGWSGGYPPTASDLFIENRRYRRIYLSLAVKLSDNWQGHESGVNKIGFAWIHTNAAVALVNFGFDGGPLQPQVRLQRTSERPDGARNLVPNVSSVEMRRGRWHHWEIVLVANTGGARDGEAHWWIDGVKAGEYRDVTFGAEGDSWWQYLTVRPIWGGRGDVVQQEMYMWLDHYYASAGR